MSDCLQIFFWSHVDPFLVGLPKFVVCFLLWLFEEIQRQFSATSRWTTINRQHHRILKDFENSRILRDRPLKGYPVSVGIHFHSRVSEIAEHYLNPKNVGSAERLARTTIRQPFTNGTRTRLQATRGPDFLPDTGRNTSDNGRLLLPNTTQTTNRIRRRPGPPWKSPDDQRRRTTNPTKKERIPNPRTILQELYRQEER